MRVKRTILAEAKKVIADNFEAELKAAGMKKKLIGDLAAGFSDGWSAAIRYIVQTQGLEIEE